MACQVYLEFDLNKTRSLLCFDNFGSIFVLTYNLLSGSYVWFFNPSGSSGFLKLQVVFCR